MAFRSQLARPPYVDPTTNIIYDTDNPEYQGWLTKQSMWLKVCNRPFLDVEIHCRLNIRLDSLCSFLVGLASTLFFTQRK